VSVADISLRQNRVRRAIASFGTGRSARIHRVAREVVRLIFRRRVTTSVVEFFFKKTGGGPMLIKKNIRLKAHNLSSIERKF
jgi:hypothetical protein